MENQPTKMKTVILNSFGSINNLVTTESPIPNIGENDVLVQVKAISINPVDVKTRTGKGLAGKLKNDFPITLGWDISGIVSKIGKSVSQFKIEDEVFGMVNFPGHGKAYAHYVAAPASELAMKPKNITHEEAAAATLAALTAWQAIVNNAKVKPQEKVLIHAASGGVGHYAVQIAKHMGAYVIGTSSAANKNFVLNLGADKHIDYKTQRFEDNLDNLDFVLDCIAGDYIERSLKIIKSGGTLISIPSGLHETISEKAKAKNIKGYFLLVQSNGDDMKSIAKLLEEGIIKSHIFETFSSLNQITNAHLKIETGRTVGKLVVKI